MGKVRLVAAVVCVGALAAISAQADAAHSAAAGFRLKAAPKALDRQCHKAGAKASFQVLCPSKFIRGVALNHGGARSSGASAFYYDVGFTGLPQSGSEQIVFGAQKQPFTLPAGKGHTTRGKLGAVSRLKLPARMVVTGTTTIGGQPAVILRMPTRHAGIYAGQRAIAWNVAAGGGQIVSLGLEAERAAKRIATAKALAASLK